MKLDPSPTQININSISKQTAAFNRAAQTSNRATSAFNQAPKSQKTKATLQRTETLKSSESTKRATFNNRMETLKATTAKLNQQTRENGKNANKIMAQAISPPGSQLSPQQLGRFIDKFA